MSENNNEVVYKWVKVEDEKDLPEDEWEGTAKIAGKSHDWKYAGLKWLFGMYPEIKIEWLKKIKPVPQSLPISNVDEAAENDRMEERRIWAEVIINIELMGKTLQPTVHAIEEMLKYYSIKRL